MTGTILGYLILISIILRFYFSIFALVLVLIGHITLQTETVFYHTHKHLEVHQKYSATTRIFNSHLNVWKCGQICYFVIDLLHTYQQIH